MVHGTNVRQCELSKAKRVGYCVDQRRPQGLRDNCLSQTQHSKVLHSTPVDADDRDDPERELTDWRAIRYDEFALLRFPTPLTVAFDIKVGSMGDIILDGADIEATVKDGLDSVKASSESAGFVKW